jgi:hypothetical protein
VAIRTAFILAAACAAFAAAPLRAAKPPTSDGAADVYRERGIAICVAESGIADAPSGGDLKAICGCAVDRFIEGRGASALAALGSGLLRGAMASELAACTAELRPERSRDVAGREAPPPDTLPEAKPPAPAPAGPVDDARKGVGFDPLAWLRGLDLRVRLAALPAWAWVAIGFLFLLLLGALFRRRDDCRHLLGPPPSMRPRAAPRPRPFRLEL